VQTINSTEQCKGQYENRDATGRYSEYRTITNPRTVTGQVAGTVALGLIMERIIRQCSRQVTAVTKTVTQNRMERNIERVLKENLGTGIISER